MPGGGWLVGSRAVLEYPLYTATDNLLMAAVLAKGTTVIENEVAKEPEVSDLAALLCDMGAVVRGAGHLAHRDRGVEGSRCGRPTTARVPDRVAAATYLAAVSAWPGVRSPSPTPAPHHMEMLLRKVHQLGVVTDMGPHGLRASATGRLTAADAATWPYPGVATHYSPLLVAMLTVADGVGILTENLFSGLLPAPQAATGCPAWAPTSILRATTPSCARAPTPVGRTRARPRHPWVAWPWCWPAWWPRAKTWVVSGAHHIRRGLRGPARCPAVARAPTVVSQ